MSNDSGMSIWVSDIDGYINIDAISRANDEELAREKLADELSDIGNIQLLAGKSTSADELYRKKISPSEWYHALHLAGMRIRCETQYGVETVQSSEAQFVRGMLDLGRQYAIARYARLENLDYQSALTATLPHGIRALINQLLISEKIIRTQNIDAKIRAVLNPKDVGNMIAYRRVAGLQNTLHQFADNTHNHPGRFRLGREKMRVILSLARLYFSTVELKLKSIDELRSLLGFYENERTIVGQDSARVMTNGRFIKGWSQRHIQPLINFYPYAIRHGLKRAMSHDRGDFEHIILVNELALAYCEISRMKRAARERKPAR